jgi:predicted membrane channel-forming protein YqfA (hemolysin III family)
VGFFFLYASYPGADSSGEPNYNPTMMHIWGIFMSIVFLVLAFFAIWRRNKAAGVAFMALFLFSIVISLMRISSALHNLH